MQSKNTQITKIQTRPIEDFIARVRTARNKGDKEIRITAKESQQLADSLSQVMVRLVTIQEEIIDTLKTAKESSTVNVEMDGGKFSGK